MTPNTPANEPANEPQEPAPLDNSFNIPLRTLSLLDPLGWLAAGWRDFRRAPAIGLFLRHVFAACFCGLSFMLMGGAILYLCRHAPIYTLALSAGFLLGGPYACLGLYPVSARLERGATPTLLDSLTAWRTLPAPSPSCWPPKTSASSALIWPSAVCSRGRDQWDNNKYGMSEQ